MKRIVNFKYNVNLIDPAQAIEDTENIKKEFVKNNEDVEVCAIPVKDDNATGIFFADDDNVTLKIKFLDENAKMPYMEHTTDIGADVYATAVEYDAERDRYIYHTGLAMEVPSKSNHLFILKAIDDKSNCYICNSLVDINKDGELVVIYKNRTSYNVECMLDEWDHMKKATQNIQFNDDANIGETVAELKSNMVEPFVMPDPMDFAPYKENEKVASIICIHPTKIFLKKD